MIAPQHLYRVLFRREHREDWSNRRFNSFHPNLPGEWITLYYQENEHDKNKYPLKVWKGLMTDRARDNFLMRAPKYPNGGVWTNEDLRAACELDGVCCFDNLEDAVSWAVSQDYEVPLVEFEGMIVCDVYEKNGYLARFVNNLRCKLVSEWKKDLEGSEVC